VTDGTNAVSWVTQVALALMALAVLLLGCAPNLLVGAIQQCLAGTGR
jgi:hypothetical protein